MNYPSLGDAVINALCFCLLFGWIGSVAGFFWQMFRSLFLSIGMLMIFSAWLDWINFDGSWPSDQPIEREFFLRRTKADDDKLSPRVDNDMTKQDWADYRRCKDVNVCVRKFAGLRRP
jgi:hypothetical protein